MHRCSLFSRFTAKLLSRQVLILYPIGCNDDSTTANYTRRGIKSVRKNSHAEYCYAELGASCLCPQLCFSIIMASLFNFHNCYSVYIWPWFMRQSLLFCYYTPQKNGPKSISNGGEISKCCQKVAKIRIYDKRRNANNLFCKLLAFLASGATRTLFPLFNLITKIKRNKKCIEI